MCCDSRVSRGVSGSTIGFTRFIETEVAFTLSLGLLGLPGDGETRAPRPVTRTHHEVNADMLFLETVFKLFCSNSGNTFTVVARIQTCPKHCPILTHLIVKTILWGRYYS